MQRKLRFFTPVVYLQEWGAHLTGRCGNLADAASFTVLDAAEIVLQLQ